MKSIIKYISDEEIEYFVITVYAKSYLKLLKWFDTEKDKNSLKNKMKLWWARKRKADVGYNYWLFQDDFGKLMDELEKNG